MEHNNFIGIGKNPDGPDLPLGLGLGLAQNPEAMDTFGSMSKEQKANLIHHIQGATTGAEARERIDNTIMRLSHHETAF